MRKEAGGGEPLGERALGGDANLVLLTGDGDGAAEHSSLAVHLDAVVQELLEGGDVHDLVLDRLAAIDGKSRGLLLALGGGGGRLLGHGSRHVKALGSRGLWRARRSSARQQKRACLAAGAASKP